MTDHIAERKEEVGKAVLELLQKHRAPNASLVIDFGCGLSLLAERLRESHLSYLGFSADISVVTDLNARGFEAEQIEIQDQHFALASLSTKVRHRPITAVVVADILIHLPSVSSFLQTLGTLARDNNAFPLIVAVPNVTHINVGASLLMGRWDFEEMMPVTTNCTTYFSPDRLLRICREAGLAEVDRRDIDGPFNSQRPPPSPAPLQSGTPLHDFLMIVRTQASEGATVRDFIRVYLPSPPTATESTPSESSPFLSVLMRTQGRRSLTIQEALLTLAAQTSQNFEVLILAHDVPDLAPLRDLADTFGVDFSQRVKIIPVVGGGRSRPLNVGAAVARGEYLAMLDDDDIVFAHWVETYEQLAALAPGRIIRTVPAEQDIRTGPWPGGREGFLITSRPHCPWPTTFDLLDHLYENRTPNCNFAVPRSVFTDLGLQFDETLPVVEDWDLLLRAAIVCGVKDAGEVTALWRKWDRSGESSSSAHSRAEWYEAREAVLRKLDQEPLLLPVQSVTRLNDLVAIQDRFRAIKGSTLWKVLMPVRFARRIKRRLFPWWVPGFRNRSGVTR